MKYLNADSWKIMTESDLWEAYKIEAENFDWTDFEDWKQDMIEQRFLIPLYDLDGVLVTIPESSR